ncbi:MAG: family 43 glycosylhydrolase [Clostridia bacterium]|nr:family 43 glycosylhydrolase [Clostridia bacterium]
MKKILIIVGAAVAAGIILTIILGSSIMKQNENTTETTAGTTEVVYPDVPQVFTNPVAPGADPFVFKDDDGTYYLYATSGDEFGYRCYSSRNLVEWTSEGYCLLKDEVYTNPNSAFTKYAFWAPEIMKYEGKYYMVYTAQHRIGLAVSDSPKGPFTNSARRYLIQSTNVIDGNFFIDDDGTVYLYFVTQRAAEFNGTKVESGNNIWGCVLDVENSKIKMDTIKLLVQWDAEIETLALSGGDCVEGPFMIKNNGTYYMTFSSNRYQNTKYSVQYATSDAPLGTFKRDKNNITLMCDDLEYKDNKNPHLYGTGHHCFVEAPNGKDLLIVYHAHRTGRSSAGLQGANLVSPRSTCLDLAWFDENGKLLAGTKEKPTVPTAVEQPLFEGSRLERFTHLTGVFEKLESCPTVYVAYVDGLDTNEGTKERPFKTIEAALSKVARGGTIVLLQSYTANTLLELPKRSNPIMITAEHNNVILTFKFIKAQGPLYMDNIILAPETQNGMSVIECNFNTVVMGEGMSCLNRPYGENDYPYLVAGKWKYTGDDTASVYDKFNSNESFLVSDKEFTLSVLGGTWQQVFEGSAIQTEAVADSAINGTVTVDRFARVVNGK